MQKLPVDLFVQEISKRCGEQAGLAYSLVDANKDLCFIEDEQQRAQAIHDLLKADQIQVDDFDYFIAQVPSYIIMINMKL